MCCTPSLERVSGIGRCSPLPPCKASLCLGERAPILAPSCVAAPSVRRLHGRNRAVEVDDFQRGADALGGAVLEADHGVDGDLAGAAIDAVDDIGIFLVDDAAADFSRPGQLAVVGIELLVEQQEFRDPLRGRQRGVDRLDLLADQRIDLRP